MSLPVNREIIILYVPTDEIVILTMVKNTDTSDNKWMNDHKWMNDNKLMNDNKWLNDIMVTNDQFGLVNYEINWFKIKYNRLNKCETESVRAV